MGLKHSYVAFPTTKTTGRIQRECDEFIAREGGMGCVPVSFINNVFSNYSSAHAYLETVPKGTFKHIAVMYTVTDDEVAKLALAKDKEYAELLNKYTQLAKRVHYTPETVKSDFIGCKNCGSRIAVKYINSNSCPICKYDLRPQSTKDKLLEMKIKLDDMQKVRLKVHASASSNTQTNWLVRLEYQA